MKKFLFILLFMCFALAGCSSTNTTINNYQTNTNISVEKIQIKPKEETLTTFATNILDKDSNRQTNISITCSTLNGTIVKSGETFSFCNTIGESTPEKGYKEAKIFDAKGNVILGYGGGNCQVSSTLYNAVLENTNFEIIERHPHSNTVEYVGPDKDAAIACGSVDFKFKNNNNFDIRIDASTDGEQVTINIVKI